MNVLKLRTIVKDNFSLEDIARVLGISLNSARVMASRYVQAGFLVRIKRNMYVLQERWEHFSAEQKFVLANLIQVPSYISLMTALSYHQISTQIQQEYYESIAQKRTKSVTIKETTFNYIKIKPELNFGFVKKQGFFIAEPEKAFLDGLYLMSLGRYHLDISSIDLKGLEQNKIIQMVEAFPSAVQDRVQRYEFA